MTGTVAGWLRSPGVRRGLLVAGFVVACFVWSMAVMGMSFAMVERGVRQWWLVLAFGLLVLVVVVAAAYGAFVSSLRAGRGADGAPVEVVTRPDAPRCGPLRRRW